LELDEYCRPIENNECTDDGFEIVDSLGLFRSFRRSGKRKQEWYSPEIILNLSDVSRPVDEGVIKTALGGEILVIDNPVFAIYPGKLWAPSSHSDRLRQANGLKDDMLMVNFHKDADCTHRFLGGAGKWRNCTTTLMTGSDNLNDVQRIAEWRGNTTLITGDEFVSTCVEIFGSDHCWS